MTLTASRSDIQAQPVHARAAAVVDGRWEEYDQVSDIREVRSMRAFVGKATRTGETFKRRRDAPTSYLVGATPFCTQT